MPPSRRRPVPAPPTTRPKVAGLRKRPGAKPDEAAEHQFDAQPDTRAEVQPDTRATDRTAEDRLTDAPTDPGPADPGTGTSGAPAVDGAAGEGAAGEGAATDSPAGDSPAGDSEAGEDGPERSSEDLGLIEPRDGAPADTSTDAPADAPAPTPRPRGRRKRAGEAVAPSVLDEPTPDRDSDSAPDLDADRDGAGGTGASAHRSPRSSGPLLPVALVVLAALLVGLGAWFQHRAGDVRYNRALVDSAATSEVAGQAREAVEKAFSYNFADVASTEKAAGELLVGKAQCQYNAIFGPVRTLAPEQKLVVTVKAVSSGVTSLDGDRATVLLFLDQVTTRTTDNQSGGGIAMMRVGAQKLDGRWKVDNMEMFGQTGDQAAETSRC